MCPAKKKKKKIPKKAKNKNLKLTEFAEFADEPECEVAYGDYCSAKRFYYISSCMFYPTGRWSRVPTRMLGVTLTTFNIVLETLEKLAHLPLSECIEFILHQVAAPPKIKSFVDFDTINSELVMQTIKKEEPDC